MMHRFIVLLLISILLGVPASALAQRKVPGEVPKLEPLQPPPPGFYERLDVMTDNDPDAATNAPTAPATTETSEEPLLIEPGTESENGTTAAATPTIVTDSGRKSWLWIIGLLIIVIAGYVLARRFNEDKKL